LKPYGGCCAPLWYPHLPYVAAAATIGFAGNEIVAPYRITVGRRIGPEAGPRGDI
jgi:hypothetical protein